jgi:hypothetical protein
VIEKERRCLFSEANIVHGIKKQLTSITQVSNEAWGEKGLSEAAVNIGTSLIGG